MESEFVTEAESAEAHIDSDPEINKPDVYIKAVFGYKDIADYVYQQSRYAEPDEDRGFAQAEESRERYNQEQDDRIDYVCESFYPGEIQTDILLIRLHFKYIPLIFSICE